MSAVSATDDLSDARRRLAAGRRVLLVRRIRSNPSLVTGATLVVALLLICLVGPLFLDRGPLEVAVPERLLPPSGENLLGTDEYGRDLLARVMHGGRISLWVGFSVAGLTALLGLVIGLLASYYAALDHVLMRVSDGLMAIPGVLLAIGLMAALGPKTSNVIIALVIVSTPAMARVVRSRAVAVKQETFVDAMRAQGAGATRILVRHIAPNTLTTLVVQGTFVFADAIITEATLSFLGAGIPAPAASWGNILYDGKTVIFIAWWMTVFPGIMLLLAVVGLNLFGDGLRDIIDPRSARRLTKRGGLLRRRQPE